MPSFWAAAYGMANSKWNYKQHMYCIIIYGHIFQHPSGPRLISQPLCLCPTTSLAFLPSGPHILRFIWPCKTDCQPIFPKIQRTYSLFCKIVICKAPDFKSRILLLDIFQMSPSKQVLHFRWVGYIFEKIFFENWTSRYVNSGVSQFHTQCMHVSRHFKLRIENIN